MQPDPIAGQAPRPCDRYEARRKQLRRAAATLATERGYAGITLTMVAARAGLSRAQAAALYALVGDLIADTIRAHLVFLTALIRQLVVHYGVGQLPAGQGPQTLEQIASVLLGIMWERSHAQQVSVSACGLTPTQAEILSERRRILHLSLAEVLAACLPGLSSQAALTLAARTFALLELEARGSDHSDQSRGRAAAAVTAAVIAMAAALATPPVIPAENSSRSSGEPAAAIAIAPAASRQAPSIHYQPEPLPLPPPAFTLPASFAFAPVPQLLDTG